MWTIFYRHYFSKIWMFYNEQRVQIRRGRFGAPNGFGSVPISQLLAGRFEKWEMICNVDCKYITVTKYQRNWECIMEVSRIFIHEKCARYLPSSNFECRAKWLFLISGRHVWDHCKYWPIKVLFVFIENMFRNKYTGGSMWAESDSSVRKTDDL